MTRIEYEVGDEKGEIEWAASEYFGELTGEEFSLGELEATEIVKRKDLSETGKILLSAVAGAVIQHLLDEGMEAGAIFREGKMRVKK